MMMKPVASSALAWVGYDEGRGRLRVEFRSRAVYQYLGVPAAVHEGLWQASSKGAYFNRVIRGRYREGILAQREFEPAGGR